MSVKNPLTLAGIEPATFRFVAQHLNHCATAVPRLKPLFIANSSVIMFCTLTLTGTNLEPFLNKRTWCIQ